MGWVCCWFSPCLGFFFSLRFSSLFKDQFHTKCQFDQDIGPAAYLLLRLMWHTLKKLYLFFCFSRWSVVLLQRTRNDWMNNDFVFITQYFFPGDRSTKKYFSGWLFCFSSGVVTVASRPSILTVRFNYNLLHQTRADREAGLNLTHLFTEYQAWVLLERSEWARRGRGRHWEKEKEKQRVRTIEVHWQ